MPVEVWTVLSCETCGEETEGEWAFSDHIPRDKLLQNAESAGWERDGDKMFCCPYCLEVWMLNSAPPPETKTTGEK